MLEQASLGFSGPSLALELFHDCSQALHLRQGGEACGPCFISLELSCFLSLLIDMWVS